MVQGAQSIYRTVDILDVLLGSHGGMTAKEVIEVAGLPASTTHRILTVLCERGLVRQDRQTRRYFPGNVWMADCLWELPRMLYNRYYDLLPRLVQEFGYTGYLLCRMGYECLCLARVESSFCVQVFTSRPGESRLLGDGAGTFGILAFLEKEERDQILRTNISLFQENMLRSVSDIEAALDEAVEIGYSRGHNFRVAGTASVAVPIRYGSDIVGTISLAGIYDDAWGKVEGRIASRMKELVAVRS